LGRAAEHEPDLLDALAVVLRGVARQQWFGLGLGHAPSLRRGGV
jgi:hypothetical protein